MKVWAYDWVGVYDWVRNVATTIITRIEQPVRRCGNVVTVLTSAHTLSWQCFDGATTPPQVLVPPLLHDKAYAVDMVALPSRPRGLARIAPIAAVAHASSNDNADLPGYSQTVCGNAPVHYQLNQPHNAFVVDGVHLSVLHGALDDL